MGQTNDKRSTTRKPAVDNGRTPRFNDARFVQYELDKDELAKCKAWNLDAEGAWDELLALCDDGYNVSIKRDTASSSYACFVSVRGDPAHPNANLILSGRGSTPQKCFKQAVFKHKTIGASWAEYGERPFGVIDD